MFRKKGQEQRGVTFQSLWGSGVSAADINRGGESQALRLAAVYACVRIKADGVSSLPVNAHKISGPNRIPVELPELLVRPSLRGSLRDWVYQLVTSLELRGNAYGLILDRDANGNPAHVEWIHPDMVQLNGNDETLFWGTRPLEWWVHGQLTTDVLHVRGFIQPGKILGLSPIEAAASTLEVGHLAQRFGRDWFNNGSVPAGIISTEKNVGKDEAGVVKDRFKQAVKGREIVAMGGGAKYQAISVSAEESQFLETKRFTATEIATIFGVPPEDVGGSTGESMTYASAVDKSSRFITFTLRPALVNIESVLTAATQTNIVFDTNALVRTNVQERYAAYQSAISAKWLYPDEVRRMEDLPSMPGGEGMKFQEPPNPFEKVDEDGNPVDENGDPAEKPPGKSPLNPPKNKPPRSGVSGVRPPKGKA